VHAARVKEARNNVMLYYENLQEIRRIGRTKRWEQDDIQMDFEEVTYDVVDWINFVQDVFHNRALVHKRLKHLFPEEKEQFLTSPAVWVYSF